MPDLMRRDPAFLTSNVWTNPVRQVMERIFEDPFFRAPMTFFSDDASGTLPLDIAETDREIVVKANLPGFKKDEIDVQMHEGVLSIRAQHSEEHEEKGDRYYRRERSYGAVSRRVALPGVVEDASVDAHLKDGVLTLRIARPEKPGPKQIEIKAEGDTTGTTGIGSAKAEAA